MAIILILKCLFFIGIFKTMACLNTNLTQIKWGHAINSQLKLNSSLQSDIDMIEADIVLGTLINGNGEKLPVMGHPPANTSDISLESFLEQILEYNKKNVKTKGVKLDFKSTEVFNGSLGILYKLWDLMTYPVWLNADIISGPVNNNYTIPVDTNAFFDGSKKFSSAVLSVGWTTNWGISFSKGIYTDQQINNMIESIKSNKITETGHEITFPLRAGIACQSYSQIQTLFSALEKTNLVTITIWSSKDDHVDISLLRELIFNVGLDKVYLDVPEEVSSKLNLGNSGSKINKLVSFSLILLSYIIVDLL